MLSPILLAVALLPFAMGQLVNEEGIRPQSSLEITIEGVPQSEKARINSIYPVRKDGFIEMWKIGAIDTEGKSLEELATAIAAAYRDAEIYDRAVFTVKIKPRFEGHCRPRWRDGGAGIVIVGQVKTEGGYEWQDGETLDTALTKAGGVKVYGSTRRVKLYRNGQTYTYNMKIEKHRGLKIYWGDIIEVPVRTFLGR